MFWVAEQIEAAALQLFAEQTSKNVSLVDCTNMAFLRNEQIEYIFSFDGVYTKNGCRTVEALLQEDLE